MGDSEDDGLMLNLNQDFNSLDNDGSSKKKSRRNSKTRHSKAKVYNKKDKKKAEFPRREHINKDSKKVGSEKGKNFLASSHSEKQHTEKPSEFISSLFSSNPEIPDVPDEKCQSKQEYELFSEKHMTETELSERLMKTLKERLGIEQLTKVQKETIPAFLSKSDVLIKSPTGSGKTLAYALPLLQRLQQIVPKINRSDGPYAMVLLPTRELALQSYEVFDSLCRAFVWIVPGLIVGGEKRKAEKSRIRKGINIIVATPGRLLDHLVTTKSLSLKNLLVLVFDEADRLLDMGFQQTISSILLHIKSQCDRKLQAALLSATLNSKVQSLASITLADPVLIDTVDDSHKEKSKNIAENDLTSTNQSENEISTQEDSIAEGKTFLVPDTLKQYFIIAPAKLRLVSLMACLLKFGFQDENGKVIVFFSSKVSTELHSQLLDSEPMKELVSTDLSDVFKLHGDMKSSERKDIFQKFKKSKKGILLCTDVAARGLDLPFVKWIIQYSCPTNIQDYIHRVGRTARIGAQGEALLFLLPSEAKYISTLAKENISMQKLGLFDVLKHLNPQSKKKINQSIIQVAATDLQNKLESLVTGNNELKSAAENAFRSYIQAYATYPASLKEIFHVKRLHLGHVAKSFALRTAPQQMKKLPIMQDTTTKKKDKKDRLRGKKRNAVDMSESGGGVVKNGPRPGGKKFKRRK
ncbi:probable ATP-dependent RNA helicase DDX31 [Rhopilema esculentum]|uniref:probable ATP-dependent RNA helicase DDX31 n=1 Tax=Rhopilema esculentum TaxID=499914 RepID=UPI0031D27AAF|eukprot:gene446-10118_t